MGEGIKYCRQCGKQLNIDAKFCRFCGYQFEAVQEVKAVINGMYIIKVSGLRGPLETPPEKKGFFKRLLSKAEKAQKEANSQKKKTK